MADVTIGTKLTLDANEAKNSVKQIKADIKAAQGEVLILAERFGATSKEAFAAAKKVAELKDRIKDANETAELFDPGKKFSTLANTVRGLVGGFAALQGALALAGVEGEDLQRTLLKVQGALALSEGLNVVADMAKDFKRLGSTIVQTLGKSGMIGIAIAGVAALGLALSGVFTKTQTAAVKAYKDTVVDYNKAAATARQTVTEVKIAFEQARQGVITKEQALKVYNDTLGDSFGKTNDLTTAEKLLADKAETYIKITALKAQANALFQKSAEQAAEALIAQDELIKSNLSNEGGVFSKAADRVQAKIDRAKSDAKDIENIGANLLRQAGQLAQQSGITTGTPTKPTADKGGSKLTPKDQAEKDSFSWMAQLLIEEENNKLRELLRLKDVHAKAEGEIDNNRFANSKTLSDLSRQVEENNSKAKIRISEEEASAKMLLLQAVGNALSGLSELIGKDTIAGKAFAVASATINTYAAIAAQLKASASSPGAAIPGYAIAQAIATGIFGLIQVKNILKTPVPGGGGGGSAPSIGSIAAPLTPQASVTNTLLNQNQLNQIGNAASRAFVVESDVTNNQERIRRLNRAARLG